MKISPDMRAAIDKAVAEGRVKKIPPGVSGIQWDQPHGWKEQRNITFKNWKRGAPRDPAVTARRERVRALHAEGKTVCEIAAATGIAVHSVNNDLLVLRLKANRRMPPLYSSNIEGAR